MARPLASRLMDVAYHDVLDEIVEGHWYPGIEETPARATKAMLEMTSGYGVDVASLFKTFEGDGYDEMVILKGIEFTSLCEHHLLPFRGHCSIGYIPDGRIIGLSKLARLVDVYARRLQVQERMTTQIADAIEEHLGAVGVIVLVEAEHLCMAIRGVHKAGVITKTSVLRGAMKDKPEARAEALSLLRS